MKSFIREKSWAYISTDCTWSPLGEVKNVSNVGKKNQAFPPHQSPFQLHRPWRRYISNQPTSRDGTSSSFHYYEKSSIISGRSLVAFLTWHGCSRGETTWEVIKSCLEDGPLRDVVGVGKKVSVSCKLQKSNRLQSIIRLYTAGRDAGTISQVMLQESASDDDDEDVACLLGAPVASLGWWCIMESLFVLLYCFGQSYAFYHNDSLCPSGWRCDSRKAGKCGKAFPVDWSLIEEEIVAWCL